VRIALVITTHERPDALAAVLDSVRRQHVAPDEIVIADDGSGASTLDVIAGFARDANARTVSQPHEGFRVARLRNLAIATATADYLVFIDGDMLLHPDFIADHARLARRGWFTQGVRALADPDLTRRLIAEPAAPLSAFASGAGLLRRAYLLRSPAAASLARRLGNGLISIKTCNFAAWRDDLVRINGFNEEFVGWGPEDKELALRLGHAGVRRQSLMFGGIAVHLHHPPASRDALPANLVRLEETRRLRRVRSDRGLDSHQP
jgi:glycosyltransferase involved in cell wall biosynthesis